MESILYRIKQLASNEKITIGGIERTIGASKGVLSRAIAKGTDIQSKWIQRIVENYPHYSAFWLLTGEGEMLETKRTLESPSLSPISQTSNEHKDNTNQVISQNIPPLTDRLLNIISEKEAMIREQAEEIGRLKEKIDQLKRDLKQERGYNASDADSLDTAIAG